MSKTQHFVAELAVPMEHASFAGHFPGHPLVPGALLLHWLLLQVESVIPHWKVRQVNSIKFKSEVHPGNLLSLAGSFDEAAARLTLTVTHKEDAVCDASFLMDKQAAS